MWRGGGGGSGDQGRQRRCLGDAVESFSSGGVVDDDRGRRTATKQSGEARCSGYSGEGNVVEVASVDEEGARDLVKMVVGI